jgi:hypothetical protein
MITGAWRAARHDKTRFKRINGYGSKTPVSRNAELITIQHASTKPKSRINLQLPPNVAMRSDSRSPNVSASLFSVDKCSLMSSWSVRAASTSFSSVESSPLSSCKSPSTCRARKKFTWCAQR